MSDRISPYLLEEPPTSTGRALLSRAFSHWCALHHGHSSEEIVHALGASKCPMDGTAQEIRFAARLLGELIASGRLRTVARPIGGGSPVPIPAGDWELDDFASRFALSAINPSLPFAPGAEPTHWIFVELDDFNDIIEKSLGESRPAERAARVIQHMIPEQEVAKEAVGRPSDDLVRLPEVMRRTGMSRSTIYRRIEQRRFPTQVEMDGNIAAWREGELADWLANPQ